MPGLFLFFASTLIVASLLGLVAKALKQPLILAYIFTGILISFSPQAIIVDKELVQVVTGVGIAFLLFLVGVELKLEDLKYSGKVAIWGGLGQILFTTFVGYIIVSALGFTFPQALLVALSLTFSSTVIIVKLFSEKNDLQSLHGKISIGFLLVQDFVAILSLMFLAAYSSGATPGIALLLQIFLRGFILVISVVIVSRFFLKWVLRKSSESAELLFVAAIAWAFLVAAISEKLGFSVAIGAFLAGVSIASSPYRTQISGRIKPVRDFFLVIFFILLGVSMPIVAIRESIGTIVTLSIFVVLGKALIVFAIMTTLRFRNRTSFLTSIALVQVSEFSLVLLALAGSLGFINNSEIAIVGAVSVITITVSSYLILYGDKIYTKIAPYLAKIAPDKQKEPYVLKREELKDHVVLIGGEQVGSDIISFLKTKISDRDKIVVVDFNPEIYGQLKSGGYNAVFGDVTDPEVLEELELGNAKIIINTDPDVTDSSRIISYAKEKNFKGPYITVSYWLHDAIKLYEEGADYVVVPETVGGSHIARILSENWEDLVKIKKEKSKRFEELMNHKIF